MLAVLVLVSLTLLTVDSRGGSASPLEPLRQAGRSALGGLQEVVDVALSPMRSGVEAVRRAGRDHSDLDRLERENAALRAQLNALTEAQDRSGDLVRLLGAAAAGRYQVVPARVVGLGGTLGFERTATLDVGSRDGVAPDMTVVTGDGLVGRVTAVTSSRATVLLVTDEVSSVGVRRGDAGPSGVLSGRGRGLLDLVVRDPSAQLVAGDRLVTFGSAGGRPYIPGVSVGEIVDVAKPAVLTVSASVRPFVDVDALDVVGVVVELPGVETRTTQRGVLPAPPTAAAG